MGRARIHRLAELREYWSQVRAAGNDDTEVNGSQFEEKAKVIEIAIENRIFAVPLDFKRDAVLDAVDFVSGTAKSCLIHHDCGREFLFGPITSIKCAIESSRNRPTVSSRRADFGFVQPESSKDLNDVVPHFRAGRLQDARGIAPLLDVVKLLQIFGNEMKRRHLSPRQLRGGYDAGFFGWDLRFRTVDT